VKKLNTTEGISNAFLGADGTSIFFDYSDGYMGIVDTFDPEENPLPAAGYLPGNRSSNQHALTATKLSYNSHGIHNVIPVADNRFTGSSNSFWPVDLLPSQNTTTLSPTSKKVLILQPICPGEKAYTSAASELPALFKANKWTDNDLNLKMNTGEIDEKTSPITYEGDTGRPALEGTIY